MDPLQSNRFGSISRGQVHDEARTTRRPSLLSHEAPRSPGNSATTWPWATPSGTQLLSDSPGAPTSNQTVPHFLNNVESVSSAKLTSLRKISEFQKHYSARLESKPHNFLSSFICGATFPANTALFLPEEGQESQTESPGSLCFWVALRSYFNLPWPCLIVCCPSLVIPRLKNYAKSLTEFKLAWQIKKRAWHMAKW